MLTLSQKNTHNRVKRCNETANLGKGNKLDLAFHDSKITGFPADSGEGDLFPKQEQQIGPCPSTRAIREADRPHRHPFPPHHPHPQWAGPRPRHGCGD